MYIIVIGGLPVQFLPSYISPLIEEAVKKAKRIKVRGTNTKILRVEYLIATLLLAFRPKDKMVIPQLLKPAIMKLLNNIMNGLAMKKLFWIRKFIMFQIHLIL